MKKLIILLFIASSVMFTACKKALSLNPTDFVSPETSYNTEADVNRALNGVYNRLVPIHGRLLMTIHGITDEYFFKSNLANNIKTMDITASNADVELMWSLLYQGINRANLLIANINKPVMDETKRQVINGEAHFLRGYYYYLLVYQFGSVPLKLEPTLSPDEQPTPSAPIAEVYKQIIADMKFAEDKVLPITSYAYNERVTTTAVQGILARVYLSMAGAPLNDISKYDDVLIYTNKVIGSGNHKLNPDYKQIFINQIQNEYDLKESIWEAGIYGDQTGPAQLAGKIGNENGIMCRDDAIGFGGGDMHIYPWIYNLYEATDLRREWNIANYSYSTNATTNVTTTINYTAAQLYERNIGKWRREYELTLPKPTNWTATNCPILRYADVLLMAAEADLKKNGSPNTSSVGYYNQVRRRAFGYNPEIPVPSFDATTFTLQDMMDERAREFAFEGLRKIDLLRWDKYVSNMQALAADVTATATVTWKIAATAGQNTSARSIFFPIPSAELRTNPSAKQNTGW